MTVDVLQATAIGKTIAALKKCADPTVAGLAKKLVGSWKALVKGAGS